MEEQEKEEMVRNYVQAYNAFDVDGMTKDMEENVRFENISDGVVTMTLNGIADFIQQAKRAIEMFSEREQTILSFVHNTDATQITIDYRGILAENLPNGLQKGDEIKLRGTSIFSFANNKIISLTDIG